MENEKSGEKSTIICIEYALKCTELHLNLLLTFFLHTSRSPVLLHIAMTITYHTRLALIRCAYTVLHTDTTHIHLPSKTTHSFAQFSSAYTAESRIVVRYIDMVQPATTSYTCHRRAAPIPAHSRAVARYVSHHHRSTLPKRLNFGKKCHILLICMSNRVDI